MSKPGHSPSDLQHEIFKLPRRTLKLCVQDLQDLSTQSFRGDPKKPTSKTEVFPHNRKLTKRFKSSKPNQKTVMKLLKELETYPYNY